MRQDRTDRIKSGGAVLALHLLLAYALVAGLRVGSGGVPADELKLFDVEPISPPQAPPPPRALPDRKAAGGSTAGAPPRVPLVTPDLPISPTPQRADTTASGKGDAATGTGTGIGGDGTGAGTGSGLGSGASVRARWLRGRITGADYPAAARRARAEGSVSVVFTVTPQGRAEGCAVTRSSGNPILDGMTCRLIERRFRYDPARDGSGSAITDRVTGTQNWWLEPRTGQPPFD